MKVIYKKTICEQVVEAAAEAKRVHREIEKFVFTQDEIRSIGLCGMIDYYISTALHPLSTYPRTVCGIPYEVQ